MRKRERVREARQRGKDAGQAAASWVFADETRAAVKRMLDDGDPGLDSIVSEPEWLSGQLAGESINELLGDIINEDADGDAEEIEEAYEQAAGKAFWREVERGANA